MFRRRRGSWNLFFVKTVAAFVALGLILALGRVAKSATIFYQDIATGGGVQIDYFASNPISGTATGTLPKFDGSLGTLIQADLDFIGTATGTWRSDSTTVGTSTLSISGLADADGGGGPVPLGSLSVSFTDTYTDTTASNSFAANFVSAPFTSGPFFDLLTGTGTVLMTWDYSGTTTLSTPATKEGPDGFSWGGSVHVLYTYEAIPEPSTFVLGILGQLGLGWVAWRRRRRV